MYIDKNLISKKFREGKIFLAKISCNWGKELNSFQNQKDELFKDNIIAI